MRKCSSPAATVTLVAMLGGALAGCNQIGMLKAKLAYKEANTLYRAGNYQGASSKYEEAIAESCVGGECEPVEINYAYFFLANSYDNMFRPNRKGQPENDANLTKALEFYQQASEKIPDPEYRKRALQYMAEVFNSEKLDDPTRAEPIIQQLIELDPEDVTNYYRLSRMYEDQGSYEQAEQYLVRARDIKPDDPDVYGQMARYYEARGDFDQMITALNMRAQRDPASPEAKYHIAVKYWEKVCLPERKECAAFAAERRMKPQYIVDGLAAAESALDIRTDYIDALVYKGLLLRSQAYLEPQRADALVKEADEIIEQVKEIQQRQKGEASAETSGTSAGA